MRRKEELAIFRYAIFNVEALCRLAGELREGHACFCDTSQIPASGSLNWTIFISFEDGVEWVLRSPLESGAIRSTNTNVTLLCSEAATLKYIRAFTKIPVPEVFTYRLKALSNVETYTNLCASATWENEIGIPYILMSKAPGFPLQHSWKKSSSRETLPSQSQKAKVVSQIGSITWQLSQLRTDKIGSLFEENGIFQLRSCLSRGLLMNGRYLLEELPRGPFSSEDEYYKALVSAYIEQAKELPLSHHCFFAPVPSPDEYNDRNEYKTAVDRWNDFVTLGSKIDGSDNRLDFIISGEILLDLLTEWREKCSIVNSENGFPLCHPDLSVNNIFVDHDYNITCLIDWTFCSSVPLLELLTVPGLPQSRNEIESSLVPAFEHGFRQAMYEDRSHPIEQEILLCQIIRVNRPMWLACRLLNFDSIQDYSILQDLWEIIRPRHPNFRTTFRSKQLLRCYDALHYTLKEGDKSADEVTLTELKYFRTDARGLSIARKLDLVSQWFSRYNGSNNNEGLRRNNETFVADRRLWKWIDQSVDRDMDV